MFAKKRIGIGLAPIVLLAGVILIAFAVAQEAADDSQIERGRHLLEISGCVECHSPEYRAGDDPASVENITNLSGYPADRGTPAFPEQALAGKTWGVMASSDYTLWAGPWGISFSANLTPHRRAGLGSWTAETFISAMRNGQHLGSGRDILPPMPWYQLGQLGDDDLRAIFAYLQTLEPVDNTVPPPVTRE